MRTIKMCAGIGDNLWVLQKLISTGEKFNFILSNNKPLRGKQLFDLMPQVVNSSEYGNVLTIDIYRQCLEKKHRMWSKIKEQNFSLAINEHLEAGKRIESWLPDLEVDWDTHFETAQYADQAKTMLPDGKTYIGLYGSSYSTSRNWGFWNHKKWLELAKKVYAKYPNVCFVVIGAKFDTDLASNLMTLLKANSMEYIDHVDKPLGLVLENMKRLAYFYSFPSGLAILSTTLKRPTMMFYPKHLTPMMNAWAHTEMIESKAYLPMQFVSPDEAFNATQFQFIEERP